MKASIGITINIRNKINIKIHIIINIRFAMISYIIYPLPLSYHHHVPLLLSLVGCGGDGGDSDGGTGHS